MALIERVAYRACGAHEGDAVPFEGFDTVRRQWRISRKTLAPIARPPSFAGAYVS
jgi:hypothetical protein